MWRNVVYGLTIVALGLGGFATLALATDGYRAFTAEEARRLAARENPAPVPAVTLEDARGGELDLARFGDRYVVLDFIYTGCHRACTTLGASFHRIQEALPEEVLGNRVALLSITFDLENDDAARLREYGERFGANPDAWYMARTRDQGELDRLLKHFQVVVIPDGEDFAHNGAIYVVGPDGILQGIHDIDAVDEVVAYLEPRL
ncbi:SCO family protein [Thioalkalivibrio sp. ALMg9]|uniref:SCO family protein n=1 Tax=Thioalkalivibrio sp. ALMg9 TaxID=1266912 RepID=UPI00036FF1F2|nr:SCO family protein [Thioalkalivibrio sp. ALMg9]